MEDWKRETQQGFHLILQLANPRILRMGGLDKKLVFSKRDDWNDRRAAKLENQWLSMEDPECGTICLEASILEFSLPVL